MSPTTSEHSTPRRPMSWIAPVALAVAAVAVALAIWAVVRSSPDRDSQTSGGQQPAEAKTQVCEAFDLVRNAVSLQTNADLGRDQVATQAVAANARLATLGGGQFLLSRLNGGVPADLADAARSFANDLQYIGMGQLAGVKPDDAAQKDRLTNAQTTANHIADLCK
ncbi:hypothetical protein [Mycolicibacterium chlorophenolicum]|nr:hypothetical protein [Mycolicibacterium chlorophenolicum]